MSGSLKKLNLGSGAYYKKGFVNVDFRTDAKPDVVHDLNKFPYPFKEGQFDLIEGDHVLEHLDHPFKVMSELHRMLAKGGKLILRVPHFSRGFTNVDHKRGYDATFAYYFDRQKKPWYCGTPFTLERVKLTWYAQPELKKQVVSAPVNAIGFSFGTVIDFFANLSPLFCSRLWCYWVGGFEQIEFTFRKD